MLERGRHGMDRIVSCRCAPTARRTRSRRDTQRRRHAGYGRFPIHASSTSIEYSRASDAGGCIDGVRALARSCYGPRERIPDAPRQTHQSIGTDSGGSCADATEPEMSRQSASRLEATDVVCVHCQSLFVVECEVDPDDAPDAQLIECPEKNCRKPNHRTLTGFQVNWFIVDAQIAAIRRWQSNPKVHPLTCGKDGSHALLRPSLESEGQIVLLCPDCDYRQVQIPRAIFGED